MASLKCANCGLVQSGTETSCKQCGASLASGASVSNVPPRYGASAHEMSYPPPDAYYPQTPAGAHASAGDYVFPPPPSTGLYQQGGVWRDHSTLVMSKEARLPDRCIKCNRPANGQRLKRIIYWHNPIYYVLIIAGVLLYFIVAMFVRWKATVQVPLCETHLGRRRILLIAGWLLFLLGIGGFILAIAANELSLSPLGFLGIFIGFILLIVSARTVLPVKIDERFIWLKGINKEYLNQLPEWGGPT